MTLDWLNPPVERNYWKNKLNRLNYLNWLGKKLNFKNKEDWYEKLTSRDLRNNYGGALFNNYFKSSKYNILKELFPEFEPYPWEYPPVPRGYWEKLDNQKKYINWLKIKLKIKNQDDWYSISIEDFKKTNGYALLITYYGGSIYELFKKLIPNHEWKSWLFNKAQKGFWNEKTNRDNYMRWVGDIYNFKEIDDWYKISNSHFEKIPKGESFLIFHDYSPIKAVKDFFPEIEWKEWFFENTPLNFWKDSSNLKRYYVWLGDQLGYKKPEDWYNITQDDLYNNRGCSAAQLGGQAETIKTLFPEYELKTWKFKVAPNIFWKIKKNRLDYLNWLGKLLKIKKIEDWYEIQGKDLDDNFGSGLRDFKKSHIDAIMEIDEDYKWERPKFYRGLKNQKKLYKLLKELFPNQKTLWNYKSKHFQIYKRKLIYFPQFKNWI